MKKLILASVALIAVFASCQKEDIRTVYETKAAVATITVNVYDAYLSKAITADATITTSAGTLEGNRITITGNKAIAAQTVTINASFDGRNGSATVDLAALPEGGVSSYAANVIVGSPKVAVDLSYEQVLAGIGFDKATGSLEYAHTSHAIEGVDMLWCVNNTEYILYGTTKYEDKCGVHGVRYDYAGLNEVEKLYVETIMAGLTQPGTSDEKEYNYTVSAFSYYNVYVKSAYAKMEVNFYRNYTLADGTKTREKVEGISNFYFDYQTAVSYAEIASPTHASHYVEGHGTDDPHYSHAHGHGGYNAGGGIIYAD